MAVSRTRSRNVHQVAGSATWYDGVLNPAESSYSTWETCNDVIGNRNGPNPFYLERNSNLWWFARGRMRENGFGWKYNGYAKTGGVMAHNAPTTPEPSDESAITQALAHTNPSRPYVDLPVFAYELKDLPGLMKYYAEIGYKQFRDRPIQELGGLYLQHEYGVKAFFRDLFRMMDFQKATERRLREFKNLRDGKSGLGRTSTVWSDKSSSIHYEYLTPLYQEGNVVIITVRTDRRKWLSLRWTASEDFQSLSDTQLLDRMMKVMFGLEPSFATIWEAMPWSWMIDWYSNIGDVYAASRNSVGAVASDICIMKSTVSGLDCSMAPTGSAQTTWCNAKGNRRNAVILTRTPIGSSTPKLDFSMPFMNGHQLSILSAIVAQRI
jgi:hypothetical protein